MLMNGMLQRMYQINAKLVLSTDCEIINRFKVEMKGLKITGP